MFSPFRPGSRVQKIRINELPLSNAKFTPEETPARNQEIALKFNPQVDIDAIGTKLDVEFTAATILVHELKHMFNRRFGLSEEQQKVWNSTFLNFEEIDAVHFENVFRLLNGMDARIKYGFNDDGSIQELTSDDVIDNVTENYRLSKVPFKNNTNQNLTNLK